jgi:hypothetical protein
MTEKPWLILTLRRTGGTSLTAFLSDISKFKTVQHEPFNADRIFGEITTRFRKDGDLVAAEAAIREKLASRPNLKHCVEIIPTDLTRILIDVCNELGYKFIVLTRRDEGRRLASLFLAVATGAWGPRAAAEIYPKIKSGDLKPEPVDLKRVENRVRTDFYSIGRTLSLLRNRQIDYPWYLFEELYFGETSIEEQAIAIAAGLGLEIDASDERLQAFAGQDGQKSSEIAPFVENYEAAVQRLEKLCSI